ncbi:nucleotide exchange factor GrpE [Salaquimonas pukyongi]|uniref:nucleotide exchange factor GrpE n=1 Tax=Salaquimonas pukyongi TaxID=2712698 RepID=UPI0009F83079
MTDNTEHQAKDAVNEAEEEAVEGAAAESSESENEAESGEKTGEEAEMEIAEQAAKSGFSSPAAFLAAEIERVEQEKSDLNDQFLRAHAEMENLRRRTQKDVADAREYSIAGFAREMLQVADNLRRAIDAVPEDARNGDDDGLKALLEGVEMTERSMMQGLEKHGVKKINPLNERFDPNFHQAMFEIPNTDVPNNTVLNVVQEGFVIGNRCLRPAMVGVSKGGPKQAAPKSEKAEETADGGSGSSQ